MALGFSSTLTELAQLLLVLSLHKCPFGFGIGMRVFETIGVRRRCLAIVLCLCFCAASPIGSVIAVFINDGSTPGGVGSSSGSGVPDGLELMLSSQLSDDPETLDALVWVRAFFSCLVCGTFLYITFVEVIPSEFSHSHEDDAAEGHEHGGRRSAQKKPVPKGWKLLALFMGFALISGLQLIGH